MSDWAYYRKGDDEDEQEEEAGEQGEGDVKYSGRDSLIFLVDASSAMFESSDEGELSPFDMTIQCIRSVYTSKIISSDRDLLALVFYGTDKTTLDTFKHIYVLHDLDTPGAKRVLELNKFRGDEGQRHFREKIGHSADFSLGEALWVCSNLFSDVKVKLSHKRVMLFTNQDNPHVDDGGKARMARTKAADLREMGIFLDLMHLKKPGGFMISHFYRDIITVLEDEDLGVHFEESAALEDLLKKVRAKEMRKRAQARLNLKLGEGVAMCVGVYHLVRSATKPYPVKLYRETNEMVKTKTRWFNTETGSLLLPSDTKRTQTYGNRQIVLEKEEVEELKRFDNPGLVLIGFKPLSMLKRQHHIKPTQFLYPDETLVTGSTSLFNALLTKCLEKGVFAVCRYTARRNMPPRFVALVPQEEQLDEQKVQVVPSGFHLISLPYADDIRKMDYTEKIPANQDQVDKMKQIVHKLRFKYRSDNFDNPVIQQHFRNLEALALDLLEPEKVEDLTMPKNEMIDSRLGSLTEEFKDLVYPPSYSSEGKGQKRKTGEGMGGAEKRPKAEVSFVEADVQDYVRKGTLGKLTVPMLKEISKQYGLRGSKKQELIDAITKHFSKP
ncbi:X-ray repair cross-complementing protein 6 [Latimeria chalumnae]|uniref:X-ray repair cross-complementing protein 6 n=1 Tax=Latimeria chalumnae TaxID=7897 RepID=UPI00313DA1D2